MRATLITTGSVLLTTAVIGNAFYHKKQFYPSVVYITKSNPSMAPFLETNNQDRCVRLAHLPTDLPHDMCQLNWHISNQKPLFDPSQISRTHLIIQVIYIQCLVMFLLLGKLMRKIFFGTLRAAELEHLIERAWYAVTETCLAFTVYRDDLNARFVGIFAILLFLKCFHWLAEDRVDFMERSPNINILFHVRIVSLLTVLATCDIAFMYFAYHSLITKGPGTSLVFGFEYAILFATILNIVMKYILHWIDIASDSPWDEKAVCLLYTELIMSILKVTLYLVFVAAMLKYHNFPLFALRPIYLSLRTLKKALCDVIMSRRAIRNMNTLYPNATQEELANTDNVCIICREEMTGNGSSKKLPCNHIFHVSCLRSWFQRQQTCPTCRMDILRLPNPSTTQPRNQQQGPAQQPAPHPPAGATGPQASSQATSSQQTNTNGQASNQPQVALNNDVTVVMMCMFAQMFLQALLANLRALNEQQLQQQRQQQQQQQQSTQTQQQSSQQTQTMRDATTQTEPEQSTTSEQVN